MSASPVTINLDGHEFPLKREHDLAWLKDLGRVSAVFPLQDSGNLCFGVKNGQKQLFVKYAGAETVNYPGNPQQAIERLKRAVSAYTDLRHPVLVHLEDSFATQQGYTLVFSWNSGQSLVDPRFIGPDKLKHPQSPFRRFRQLSVEQRLDVLDKIYDFHVFAERQGYVAVDFYDGCLLYNFSAHTVTICDIDLYHKGPLENTMGRMWGSSRFMAPEEFQMGARIDYITNVFNMGATAFVLLGGQKDRSLARWEASEPLFHVATTAISPERNRRHGSVRQFVEQWQQARL